MNKMCHQTQFILSSICVFFFFIVFYIFIFNQFKSKMSVAIRQQLNGTKSNCFWIFKLIALNIFQMKNCYIFRSFEDDARWDINYKRKFLFLSDNLFKCYFFEHFLLYLCVYFLTFVVMRKTRFFLIFS